MLSGPQKALFGLAIACAVAMPLAWANAENQRDTCERSQDCALGALKSGEIKPLTEVLAVARAKIPGEVIKIELEREHGIWVYEITILTASGRRREIEINAATLAILKID